MLRFKQPLSYDDALFRQKLERAAGGKRVTKTQIHQAAEEVMADLFVVIRQAGKGDELDEHMLAVIVPGLADRLRLDGWEIVDS